MNRAAHTNPSDPVTTNAALHPHCSVTYPTSAGAIIAPRLAPLLQIPIASVRISAGTHIAAAFANAGHAADSPTASRLRIAPKLHGPRTSDVRIPAADHHRTPRVSPRPTPMRSSTRPA